MKAKIDWYKEVLELEPGSKVFFPLARLLAENGQLTDALSTLRLGLERHPEFIEARLYLIELLYTNGEVAQCEPQIGRLTRLFSNYPGFWEAWGACGEDRELSLTLQFLALLFKRRGVTFSDILEQGIKALVAAPVSEEKPQQPAPEAADVPRPEFAAPPAPYVEASPVVDKPEAATQSDIPVLRIEPPDTEAEEAEEHEEPFSLRTKSMADVLAGQGDSVGALEIYRELLVSAQSAEERAELQERIARLSASEPELAAVSVSTADVPLPGNRRMRHLLESLAERLEARASE